VSAGCNLRRRQRLMLAIDVISKSFAAFRDHGRAAKIEIGYRRVYSRAAWRTLITPA
jgi:hypothetical protein